MPIVPRILLIVVAAVVVTFGYRFYDQSRGAEWEVSPQQIAKAKGQLGLESSPGTVTMLPIRSETADVLPVQWGLAGLVAGIVVWSATRRRRVR